MQVGSLCLIPVLIVTHGVAGGNLLLNPYAALAVEQEMFQSHRKFVQSDGVAAILLVKWVEKFPLK